jgi:hypothetical protein
MKSDLLDYSQWRFHGHDRSQWRFHGHDYRLPRVTHHLKTFETIRLVLVEGVTGEFPRVTLIFTVLICGMKHPL